MMDTPPSKQLIISWPGQQMEVPLDAPLVRLGRSDEGNEVIIDHPVVSRHHAMLKWTNDGYLLIDGQMRDNQHVLSTNGLFFEGRRVVEHKLQNGDILRIPDRAGNFIILMYFDDTVAPPAETTSIELDHEITIGRDKRNDLVLPQPTVSAFHATIFPKENGHAIRDLKSNTGTFVNGWSISQVDLHIGDLVQIGPIRLRYETNQLVSIDPDQHGIRLEALKLRKQINEGQFWQTRSKTLLDNVSLAIEPGEFVAIVGMSGSGKSTLLNALNGSARPEGQVFVNGYNLYRYNDVYQRSIGYVPQDDIIHADLKVAEALFYVARLRLPPDMPMSEIDAHIEQVLQQVGMLDQKNMLVKKLSGGQRKRVSIAVELIADPGIIFLDEPTAGLDPGLEKKLMFMLKQLARAGKTVIMITHTTVNITDCHLVAFMAMGGRLVFYGSPYEALDFFKVDDFALIYNKVELEPDKWFKAFQRSPYYQTYIQTRLADRLDPQKSTTTATPHIPKEDSGLFRRFKVVARQTHILTQRYLTILTRDKRNLLFLLLQAPVIAFFLYLVINDTTIFSICQQELIKPSDPPNCEITFQNIADIQKYLFILACIATWFGIINAIREIAKELPIYWRERLVHLSVTAYVSSKLILLLGLSIIQTSLLVLPLHFFVPFATQVALIKVFLTITLTIFTSSCFGLFLSAVIQKENRVMSIVPIFLIPQIIFAGIIFPFHESKIASFLSMITFSRWSVEALGSTLKLSLLHEAIQLYTPSPKLPFPFEASDLMKHWAVLIFFAVLSIVGTIVALKFLDKQRSS